MIGMTPATRVVHLVASDTSSAQGWRLAALRDGESAAPRVVHLGGGAPPHAIRADRNVPLKTRIAPLVARDLEGALGGADLVHVWSAWAARKLAPRMGPRAARALLIELDLPEPGALALPLPGAGLRAGYVVPSATAQAWLAASGVARDSSVVIRPGADSALLQRADRAAARAALGLATDQIAVFSLPNLARDPAAKLTAWATLIVARLCPGVRLIGCPAAPGFSVFKRFAESAAQAHVLRPGAAAADWPISLAAADLLSALPTHNGPTDALAWAMAAGVPIVASATPANREYLQHGVNATLCAPGGGPREAARHLLHTIENLPAARAMARVAQDQARAGLDVGRMRARYARAYQNLLCAQPVGQGIEAVFPTSNDPQLAAPRLSRP